MSPVTYSIVQARRTQDGQIREGWIVERTHGLHHTHASVLFTTPAEAEAERKRLEAMERKSRA